MNTDSLDKAVAEYLQLYSEQRKKKIRDSFKQLLADQPVVKPFPENKNPPSCLRHNGGEPYE